ncbi:MAG: DNA methyltransferase [Acidimicrobiia bacterium]
MARIEDLLKKIDEPVLRADLEREVAVLKEHVDFGLVFERHIPETVDLLYVEPAVGDLVRLRPEDGDALYRVFELSAASAMLTPLDSAETIEVAPDDLLVVKPFGEPVYPALTPLESVVRSEERPFHAVINGENLHVVQLLLYLYEGKVDCLYLDPPYNSGATDWKYNNRYVDATDRYRHSKWLSMMERRLRLARRLLKPDGVLIVTIDENEVYHLGVLLEELFREYLRYQVTIVINPKGTAKVNFARVEEYALFLVPDTGSDVIVHLPRPRTKRRRRNGTARKTRKSPKNSTRRSALSMSTPRWRRRAPAAPRRQSMSRRTACSTCADGVRSRAPAGTGGGSSTRSTSTRRRSGSSASAPSSRSRTRSRSRASTACCPSIRSTPKVTTACGAMGATRCST